MRRRFRTLWSALLTPLTLLTLSGAARVRAMVGSSGVFVLELPGGGAWRLSGMRVGYLPTRLGTFDVVIGERTTLPRPLALNAPDAEVLLSESFVGSHCYRLSAPHPEQPEWVGVTFVPAQQRRGIAEVRGTLWLDRATSELRRLEYLFVDLPTQLEATTPRGLVEFARLPGDVWVVTRWEMRLPRAGNAVTRTGTAVGNVVRELNAMQVSGGEVASVRRGDVELFRSDAGPADRFPDIVARLGAAPACLDSPTVPADEAGIVYGTITDSLGRPVRGTARLNWTAIGRTRGTSFQRERNVSAMDGFFLICNINVGPTLTLLVFDSEGRASEPVKLRLQRRQPWAAIHRTSP